MNEFEKLSVRLDVMTRRVKVLEESIRPLAELKGIDAAILSDQAVISFAAESIGSSLTVVCGECRTREASGARRQVAALLRVRAAWSLARIGRGLNRTEGAIRTMIREQTGV